MQAGHNETPPCVGVVFVSCALTHIYLPKNPSGMTQGVEQSFWLLLQKDKSLGSLEKQEIHTFSHWNQALVVQMLFSAEKVVNLDDTYAYSTIG